jgi:two-component system sensor histidine kinase KdpD
VNDSRPSPDELLARIQSDQDRAQRAKLKIFFGASAGVGKTYAMLVEAHERLRAGGDVVVGLVETHGRPETAALLDGFEMLARRATEYRGTALREFDLDAALKRAPQLLLLDELAHTNVPGSRHLKRWQDVRELLEAGIDVYTTLNVQHVESVRDLVAQVTGVDVRETVPDSILERADVIELVDLPPDDLIQRMREGKVYVPEQAREAVQRFFRKGNLLALRELALRVTAERVDAEVESYRRIEGISEAWGVRERVLVCVGDPLRGLDLVRAARRLVTALRAEWWVLHVERADTMRPGGSRDQIVDVLGFAEELGAQTGIVSGSRIADEVEAFAREHHVTRVVVGPSTRSWWWERIAGSISRALTRAGAPFDVVVLQGEPGEERLRPTIEAGPRSGFRQYLGALAAVLVCTAVGALMAPHFELTNVVMAYLFGVVLVSLRFGRGPSITAAVLSVAAFDFFFVPPAFTFNVSDTQYLITFTVMLAVAVSLSTLTHRLRAQTDHARQRERRATALFRLSRELAAAADRGAVLQAAVERISDLLDIPVSILLAGPGGRLERAASTGFIVDDEHERGVAQWVMDNLQPAGMGTPTLPGAHGLYLPLPGRPDALGVLALHPADGARLSRPDVRPLLETFANQIALALERVRAGEQAESARIAAEGEEFRNTLLASVSHDLRTPLTVMTGAATTLLQPGLDDATRRELLSAIAEEGARLNRLVTNLLDMSRLAGPLRLQRQWHSLQEIVGATLARLTSLLAGREVRTDVPPTLFALVDEVLLGQALFNLIENAARVAPPGTAVEVQASREGDEVVLAVADRGPGLPPGSEERVFEKFWRGDDVARGGAGLGLAICRGFVEAHGGRVRAENRPGGGSRFEIRLPAGGDPPVVDLEEVMPEGNGETT